ncbi:MAG: hypothetical protein GY765_28455, partial [bacterium]|nr:hypothetical protein [bacterium]
YTVEKLIRRHESLRTTFHMIDEKPVQKIAETVEFEIEYLKKPSAPHPTRCDQARETIVPPGFVRPFELTRGPLMRVGVMETTGKDDALRQWIMIDMHHIITDGTSQQLLLKEFNHLKKGETLLPLKRQYRDYAGWQNSRAHKHLMKGQEKYWVNRLAGELPILNLPTDYPRPVEQRFEGNTVNYMLNRAETGQLKKTAEKNSVPLYMAILSIFTILLSKLSG